MFRSLPSSLLTHSVLAGLISLLLLLGSLSAQAQNTWTGTTNRDWNTATNWSGGIPTASSDVVIPSGANQPILSTTAVAFSVEVQSGASLSISSAGSLTINGSKTVSGVTRGFYNVGTVVNGGALVLGNTASVGQCALWNRSSFTNTATGSITIDRSSSTGFLNELGNFVNSGSLSVGNTAAVGYNALWNRGSFTNTADGNITLDNSSQKGLYNHLSGSNFVNSGSVRVGTNVTGSAIDNGGTFGNQGCAALIQSLGNGVITNTASLFNTGNIIESSTGNSGISFNGGLVQNLNGGTFTITTNTGVLTTSPGNLWTGCTSRDWNTATNWSGGIPTPSSNVVIPPGPANQPILNDPASASTVEVQSGASLSISSAGSLSVNGSKLIAIVSAITGFYNDGTVVSGGALVLGNTAAVGGVALWNRSSFTNMAGGSITLNNSSFAGLFNGSGSFVNSGSLSVGNTAAVGPTALWNQSSFTNTAGGSITLDRSSGRGLYNEINSSFVNSGSLSVGNTAAVGDNALWNRGSFTNTADGNITLDRSNSRSLYNQSSSSFVNSGSVNVGTLAAVGDYALYNQSSFTNMATGKITLDNSIDTGLYNGSGSSFVNSGSVNVGTLAAVGQFALHNHSSFTNTATGKITLDNSSFSGLENSLGSSFVNSGSLTVGSIAAVGRCALYNFYSFTNTAGGSITLDNSSNMGLENSLGGNFVNSGSLTVGSSVTGIALNNRAPFNNNACATLHISHPLFNTNSFTNAGFFTVSTTQSHTNTGTLTNNGVISYPQGNPIPNVTNNALAVNSFSVCGTASTTALQIGGTNSFTVGGMWYKDPALTTAGGTYNQATNTFTPGSLSVGVHTLYVVVTDNTCSQTLTISVTVQASPTRLYVNASQTAVSGGDGLTWATAFKDLQRALTYPCSQSLTEIWVAGGTYKPTSTTSRTVSFTMLPGVAIYGGLAGTEPNGYDMTLRNFAATPSILSGDIDGVPDVVTGSGPSLTITGNAGNSYHVVLNNNNGLTSSAILDGFTISGGNANSPTPSNDIFGGGMFNNLVSPTLRNVTFSGNNAVFTGGGLYTSDGNLTLTKCQFTNNLADFGGAIQTHGTVSSLTATITMTDCSLTGNRSFSAGGGINHGFSNSLGNLLLDCSRCVLTNNYAFNGSNFGSAGAFFNEQVGYDARFTNCLFDGNQGLGNDPDEGGGALLVFAGAVTVINSTFINNRAAAKGGAIRIYLGTGTVNIKNSIFWNNTATTADNDISTNTGGVFTIQNSLLQVASCPTNITCGTGMLYGQDPRFVNLASSNVRLTPCSPAINTGDPATTLATVGTTDLLAQPRFFNAGTVDMGAAEYQGESVTSFTVLGSGTVTCASSPTITLNGSQTGVTYQLQREGVSTGAAEPGTGAALSFGPQSVTGIYSVVATNTASSCTLAMAQSATVVSSTALPVASLSAVSLSFCAGSSLTLTASGGVNYTFSSGATQTGGSSSNTATVTQSGVYTVTVANASGCTSTTTISVTAIPAPSLVNGPAASSVVCVGASVVVPVSATGSGNLTYAWYQNGNLVSGQTSATLSLTNTQTSDAGSYSVVVTGACGSVTSTAFSLTVNPIPVVTITPGPGLTISSIQTATLTASGANSFLWSTGANTAAIQVSVGGTYSVTGTTNGCSGTASVVLSVTSAAPIITTQPATASSVCEGTSVMVSVVVSNSVTSYQWLKGGSPVAGQTTATLSLGSAQVGDAGVYSLSLTGPAGTTSSSNFTLTVNPVPVVTLTIPVGTTAQGSGGIALITLPANGFPTTFQAFGGSSYERKIIMDQVNGFEIRQVDQNTTGIFPINRLGLFTLTVTGAGGCKRTVQWVITQ